MLWEVLLNGVKRRCVNINIENLGKERGHREDNNFLNKELI
jgi:hypothetical protein